MFYRKRKPLIKYRFKDRAGFVTFETFTTEKEARRWFEDHKSEYGFKEFENVGITYKSRTLDTLEIV